MMVKKNLYKYSYLDQKKKKYHNIATCNIDDKEYYHGELNLTGKDEAHKVLFSKWNEAKRGGGTTY